MQTINLNYKANGLHSGTIIRKYDLDYGVVEQWHKAPVTGEIIVLRTWRVHDGECSSSEFEVVEVIPKGGLVGKLKELVGGYKD